MGPRRPALRSVQEEPTRVLRQAAADHSASSYGRASRIDRVPEPANPGMGAISSVRGGQRGVPQDGSPAVQRVVEMVATPASEQRQALGQTTLLPQGRQPRLGVRARRFPAPEVLGFFLPGAFQDQIGGQSVRSVMGALLCPAASEANDANADGPAAAALVVESSGWKMSVLSSAGDETNRLGRSPSSAPRSWWYGSLDQPGDHAPDVPSAAPCRARKRHGSSRVEGSQLVLIEVVQPACPDRGRLTDCLSRMRGDSHVRFLGEGMAARPAPHPTANVGSIPITRSTPVLEGPTPSRANGFSVVTSHAPAR